MTKSRFAFSSSVLGPFSPQKREERRRRREQKGAALSRPRPVGGERRLNVNKRTAPMPAEAPHMLKPVAMPTTCGSIQRRGAPSPFSAARPKAHSHSPPSQAWEHKRRDGQ